MTATRLSNIAYKPGMSEIEVLIEKQNEPGAASDTRWHLATILTAPHRLGFTCAVSVLIASGLWWLLVQCDRFYPVLGLHFAFPVTFVHAVVMVFGFMPLFFSGFLFTAGPAWLNVPGYTARQLAAPLLLQLGGWVLWLTGSLVGRGLSVAAVLLAVFGLAWTYRLFWHLIRISERPDRKHAKAAGVGGVVGVLCLAGIVLALLSGHDGWVLALARTALWGYIVVTFSSVAHRMIPFFTSRVVTSVRLWRPDWILWLMLGIAAFEVLAIWVDFVAPGQHAWPAWTVLCISVELLAGAVLLWLALAWGFFQSLKDHLLAMLHIGFTWFGLALWYSALSQFLWLRSGEAVLGVGALHAFAMGFLGSLILAMVTRVTCGHSGRPLVADRYAWGLFLALQVTVVIRLLAAVQGMPGVWTVLAAFLWAAVVTLWGGRFLNWYGRPRVDGKPG